MTTTASDTSVTETLRIERQRHPFASRHLQLLAREIVSPGQGVTQTVRAAGDGNSAYNNVSINVTEANQAPALVPGQGQVLISGQTITGSNAAGTVSVSAANGGIQMAILANSNQGNTLQQVAQGNLLQNTRLLGDSNMVNNLTQLNVVLRNNGPSSGALDCNLSTLNGLRNF